MVDGDVFSIIKWHDTMDGEVVGSVHHFGPG